MEICPSCAAEYARQRDLTTALRALAAEMQEWKAPAAMEHRLLAAFAERQENGVPVGARVATSRWRYALAAAAVLTLAVWGIREAAEPTNRRTDELPGKASAPEATEGRATAAHQQTPPAVSERSDHAGRTPPAVSERVDRASRTPPAVSERVDRASRTATSRTNPRPANPRAATVEFMRIPSAIGLPELESGTVLRMELPLAALPEYGLDIAPDAMRTSVEADVLVGQDGQPRAIRLVGISERVAQDSRSRQ
jgi:hypothetical protein